MDHTFEDAGEGPAAPREGARALGDTADDDSPFLLAPPDRKAAAAAERAAQRRRRRRSVTRDRVRRAGAERSRRTGKKLTQLWDSGREDSRRLAARYRTLLETTQDPLGPDWDKDEAAMDELNVSLALRCARTQAARILRETHRVGNLLPRTLERLGQGDLPVGWFEKVLERTSDLEDDAVRGVDEALGKVALDITPESFSRELGHLITSAISRTPLPERATPAARRRVVMDPPRPDGTGCLRIIGPLPEILDLAERLDRAAHCLQDAQRDALYDGTEVPGDPGGLISASGVLPTLSALRFDLLLAAALDTDGVEVPEPRFRITVTVPFMTMLGESDAPGMLDGTTPLPAEMARELAGREDVWYRILTDPATGRFLPQPAQRYRPSPAQREHLRQRQPTCAVPGCGRPTRELTEFDHIEEFDHEDPAAGGPTSVENLHALCRQHHRLKTLGRLDPVRDDESGTTWWMTSEHLMARQEDSRDLATPQVVEEMTEAWEQFEAMRLARIDNARRLREALEQGLSPGDPMPGPAGEDGWRLGRDGSLQPPGDPPPF